MLVGGIPKPPRPTGLSAPLRALKHRGLLTMSLTAIFAVFGAPRLQASLGIARTMYLNLFAFAVVVLVIAILATAHGLLGEAERMQAGHAPATAEGRREELEEEAMVVAEGSET